MATAPKVQLSASSVHMPHILLCSEEFTIQFANLGAHLVGTKLHQDLLKSLEGEPEPLGIFHIKSITESKQHYHSSCHGRQLSEDFHTINDDPDLFGLLYKA